jgi:hypothetical protein
MYKALPEESVPNCAEISVLKYPRILLAAFINSSLCPSTSTSIISLLFSYSLNSLNLELYAGSIHLFCASKIAPPTAPPTKVDKYLSNPYLLNTLDQPPNPSVSFFQTPNQAKVSAAPLTKSYIASSDTSSNPSI